VVQIRLDQLSLRHPRQWGGCWLALELYRQLGLDTFLATHLPASRKGTRWDRILQVLVTYRLLAPGSEWRCIGTGLSAPRWPICLAAISVWPKSTSSTPRWTGPAAEGETLRASARALE